MCLGSPSIYELLLMEEILDHLEWLKPYPIYNGIILILGGFIILSINRITAIWKKTTPNLGDLHNPKMGRDFPTLDGCNGATAAFCFQTIVGCWIEGDVFGDSIMATYENESLFGTYLFTCSKTYTT